MGSGHLHRPQVRCKRIRGVLSAYPLREAIRWSSFVDGWSTPTKTPDLQCRGFCLLCAQHGR